MKWCDLTDMRCKTPLILGMVDHRIPATVACAHVIASPRLDLQLKLVTNRVHDLKMACLNAQMHMS
jgi:hypothetical protein